MESRQLCDGGTLLGSGDQAAVGLCHWLRSVPPLEAFLGCRIVYPPFRKQKLSALAIWGERHHARVSTRLAMRLGLPCVRILPGFFNALPGGIGRAPLSVVFKPIYDPGHHGSRPLLSLERLVCASHPGGNHERAGALVKLWRRSRLSRCNHAREDAALPANYVLVIDQPAQAAPERTRAFRQMLESASAAHPDVPVVIRSTPRQGYFARANVRHPAGVRVVSHESHPAALLENAGAVYTVDSLLGFEALLWGRPVHTFAAPFYTGWGLTTDAMPAFPSRKIITLDHLVHAVLIECSRYRHPETGRRCEVEEIMDWLGLQRRMRSRFPATLYATKFSPRKRRILRGFLQGSTVHFVRDPERVPRGASRVVWGCEQPAGEQGPLHVEDGFLRSVGMGAGLTRPLSWVLDKRGIYYDSTACSDLEHLLQTMNFEPTLLARAQRLKLEIVASGLTKYNVGSQSWKRPANAEKVILVPGQVQADASLRLGTPSLRTNLELLRAVRTENPDAYLLYKPHPDVVAGLRAAGEHEKEAAAWCDETVVEAPIGQLFQEVDEVHVLTSLAGFEALLRGKPVTCYGQPFYAGWGLTVDRSPLERRTRRLIIEELTAGVLILYPTYISRTTGHYTSPERVLEELQEWRAAAASPNFIRRQAEHLLNNVLRILERRSRQTLTNRKKDV